MLSTHTSQLMVSFLGFIMPDKFEIRKDSAGKFRFNLIAANGEIIVSSEAYETKEACKNGIQSVKRDAPTAETVDESLLSSVSPLQYCETCGTPITSGVLFCTNCGGRIRQEELKPPSPKRVIPVRSILVIVVVLMAGVAAGSFMTRPAVPPAVPQNQLVSENSIVSLSPTTTVVSVSPTTIVVVTTLTPTSSTSSQMTTTITSHETTSLSTSHIQTSSAIIYSSATTYVPPPVTSRSGCDPSYPTVCIPPPPPDLDCKDIPYRNFQVLPPDPHRFDGDHDGIGCET